MVSGDELECHTSKFKISEAGFWRDEMNNIEHYSNEVEFLFYLNAFLAASFSAVEYVFADFMFHHIKNRQHTDPNIWKNWNKDERKKHRQQHPNASAITKFYSTYQSEKKKLEEIPFIDYFLQKRHLITHTKLEFGGKAKVKVNVNTGKEIVEQRFFCNDMESKEEFLSKFSLKVQNDSLNEVMNEIEYLMKTEARTVLDRVINELTDFIKKFEGKDFFS
ncbi:hypothetical protein [Nitrosopumilus sp.]|uniref:hypothetical protein n=1 Tax=Nitrosopumilus sp. TaxID=2024843 RepID=UPI003D13AC06